MSKGKYRADLIETTVKRVKFVKEKIKKLKKEKKQGVNKNRLSEINSQLFDLDIELKKIEPRN